MAEPVSLALAKQHLEYEDDDRDDLINGIIAAARAWVEDHTGVILVQRAVVETRDAFGPCLELHHWPVASITSITYLDGTGATQPMTAFRASLAKRPARVFPSVGSDWPAAAFPADITVTYEAGFTDVAADCPALLNAMLLLIGHWFANREAVGDVGGEIRLGVEALCREHRRLST